MMQIGCCCPVENAELARAVGFDYIECRVVSLQPDEDQAPDLERYAAAVPPVQAFNVFLPGDLKIVGPAVDDARVSRYVQRALDRVHQAGGRVIVFGSGGARSIPEGFPRAEAVDQIVRFLHTVADVAEPLGLRIAIEPLNRRESNVINTVAEATQLARRVDRDEIRVLADFYHMALEEEPLEHLVAYKGWIIHVHVADTHRHAPGTGQYPYDRFAAQLRAADYDGMVSIECRWNDFEAEAPPAVQFLRRVLA